MEGDREQVRYWALRSLLRQGIWGRGLDSLLTRLRTAIKEHGVDRFPVAEIEQTMGEVGKSLAFDEDAVQGLLKIRYGERNCFPLLSLIYPGNDSTRRHVDHVYPQTAFTRAKLEKIGLPPEQIAPLISMAQEIPNLQLLTPTENESKSGRFPAAWLASAFPDENDRAAIRAFHHLGDVDDDLAAFEDFFTKRREKLGTTECRCQTLSPHSRAGLTGRPPAWGVRPADCGVAHPGGRSSPRTARIRRGSGPGSLDVVA